MVHPFHRRPGWRPEYSEVPAHAPYGSQPQIYYASPPVGRTNGFAIASMVLGIVWLYWIGSILAIIFGHIAISQSRKDEMLRGRGMAIAGLVLGYVGIGVLVVALIAVAASSST